MLNPVFGKAACMGVPIPKRLRKIVLVMKLTALILLVSGLHVAAKGVSQERINLSVDKAPLENVFQEIERQTSYVFFYNKELVKDKTVSVKLINASINETL